MSKPEMSKVERLLALDVQANLICSVQLLSILQLLLSDVVARTEDVECLEAIGKMNKTIPTHLELCKSLESELKEICNE